MRPWFLSLLFLSLLGLAQALSSSGSRLLVVLDELSEKDKYSQFWNDLENRGYKLTFESPKKDPALFKHGERVYDHLLILPLKLKGLGPALTPSILLDFIENEGNILLTLSADAPTPTSLNSLLLELDIHLPSDRSSLVVDHFNFDTSSSSEKHDVLLISPPVYQRKDIKNFFGGEGVIAFPRSVGQTLGNDSPLLISVLNAPLTAYSYNPKDEIESVEDPFAVGSQLSLVSAMQARNSARFTVIGSAETLENTWFDAEVKSPNKSQPAKTANQDFAAKISGWTFKELGVLKVGRLQHYLNEGRGSSSLNDSSVGQSELNPKIYRIKNDVTFSVELSEYSQDHLTPFAPPSTDSVQLEFSMLSPFHRLPLTPTSRTANSTIYTASFKLPDQHGIFNFRVNYKRPFYTNIDEKRTVTVRHFAHDEWPRSWKISGAWVWIAGIWVTVAGWLAFVGLWLWSEPTEVSRRVKKRQ